MDERKNDPPPIAPAPPPTPEAAAKARATRGFATSRQRLGMELATIAAVVLGLGSGAFMFAGALASWLTPLLPPSVDRTLGSAAAQTSTWTTCEDPAALAYIEHIARPLLAAAGPVPFEFEFRLADDSSVNAYALPGGFVTVHRGLLEAAENGDEVAGVLGHEIQHALLRHGTRRMLRQLGGSVLLSLLAGGGDLERMGAVVGDLTSLAYDRDQELEADRQGVALLVAAQVDPRGLSHFFERLRVEAGPTPPALLSTHPEPERRAALVREAAQKGAFRALPPPPEVHCGPGERD